MEKLVIQRIKEIISVYGLSQLGFSKKINIPQTTISNIFNRDSDVKYSILESILNSFGDISAEWLLRGEGEMMKDVQLQKVTLSPEQVAGSIPYFADLPVSAGRVEMGTGIEIPTGFVNIPGVSAQFLFPVIGCSMLPLIKPGDIVGVKQMERWECVDPDKIYMIVTNDGERMIKRLIIDEESEEKLKCLSDNMPSFSIFKCNIYKLYQVVFHGELV